MRQALTFLLFAVLLFFQNAAFTWSSRSRNSGDPNYHRKAAWASNGVYWACNLVLTEMILQWTHKPVLLAVSGLIYVLATTEGSVMMMRVLLKKEAGKRLVGAR